MKKIGLSPNLLSNALRGMLSVLVLTVPMWLIGRNVLGEAVISLLYLAPIALSAGRWGQVAGVSAALTASLCFDFLFIPPFYTFAVGSLEGWLVLVIFFVIAIVVVGGIQDSLSKAREATFMYELSSALANARAQDAVAHIVAGNIRQLFQAALVNVVYQQSKQAPRVAVSEPLDGIEKGRPDRILPIMNAWGLVGEIQIWQGEFGGLPSEDSRLLQNFALQAAKAFERTLSLEMEKQKMALLQPCRYDTKMENTHPFVLVSLDHKIVRQVILSTGVRRMAIQYCADQQKIHKCFSLRHSSRLQLSLNSVAQNYHGNGGVPVNRRCNPPRQGRSHRFHTQTIDTPEMKSIHA